LAKRESSPDLLVAAAVAVEEAEASGTRSRFINDWTPARCQELESLRKFVSVDFFYGDPIFHSYWLLPDRWKGNLRAQVIR
jgi:hypothetical protein